MFASPIPPEIKLVSMYDSGLREKGQGGTDNEFIITVYLNLASIILYIDANTIIK